MPSLTFAPATADEIPAYLTMRDAAAADMVANGVVQWQPGELTVASLLDWMGDGQLYLARAEGTLVGGLIVMWSDPVFWGDDGADAGYTHGLLVDRTLKGRGLGRHLLAFAEHTVETNGRSLSRLDTVTSNAVLRRYYRDAGYQEVGERVFDDAKVFQHGAPIGSVTLLEKKLAG